MYKNKNILKRSISLKFQARYFQSDQSQQKFVSKLVKVHGEILFGINPVFMALEAKNRSFHQIFYNPQSKRTDEIITLATSMNIQCTKVPRHSLNNLSSRSTKDFEVHQGVCADVTPLALSIISDYQHALDLLSQDQPHLWLLLCGISDSHNLGAIIRSAYFFGVDRVFTCSFKTGSSPITSNVSKASAGVVEIFPPSIVRDPESFLDLISKKESWTIISSGLPSFQVNSPTSGGVALFDEQGNQAKVCSKNVILLVGNEGRGIPSELSDFSKLMAVVRPNIVTNKRVDSLNVSVATAILLQYLNNKV